MSAYDQQQCIHCLDKIIEHLDVLEKNLENIDVQECSYRAKQVANSSRLAKMYLELWNEPDTEEEIRDRELEAKWADYEPEVYDSCGNRIIY